MQDCNRDSGVTLLFLSYLHRGWWIWWIIGDVDVWHLFNKGIGSKWYQLSSSLFYSHTQLTRPRRCLVYPSVPGAVAYQQHSVTLRYMSHIYTRCKWHTLYVMVYIQLSHTRVDLCKRCKHMAFRNIWYQKDVLNER